MVRAYFEMKLISEQVEKGGICATMTNIDLQSANVYSLHSTQVTFIMNTCNKEPRSENRYTYHIEIHCACQMCGRSYNEDLVIMTVQQ